MKILRIIGIGLIVLVVLVGALAAYGIANTNRQLNATIDVPEVADIPLPTDEASLAEGQRLFQIMNCVECYGVEGGGGVVRDWWLDVGTVFYGRTNGCSSRWLDA